MLPEVRPHFIALYIACRYIANFLGHDALTFRADQNQQFQNGRMMNAAHALNAGDGVAFEPHREYQFGLLDGHVHAIQVILSRLQKSLRALATLISLVALAVVSLALTFGAAIVASHCDSPGGKSQPKSA
jgi:chaperone required for assembly of F1-ATPase